MKNPALPLAAIAFMASSAVAPASAATLVGANLQCSGDTTLRCSQATATVGAGPEFYLGTPFLGLKALALDFTSDAVTVYTNFTFSGVVIGIGGVVTLTDLTKTFNQAVLTSSDGTTFTQSRIALSGNVLKLDFGRTTFQNGAKFTVKLLSGVPEPATWAMMILGFGAVGYAMRRRAKLDTRIRFA